MLVLSRKVGERILIGDNISVVVSRVGGGRVTLGVEAPVHIGIRRGELNLVGSPNSATQKPAPAGDLAASLDRPPPN